MALQQPKLPQEDLQVGLEIEARSCKACKKGFGTLFVRDVRNHCCGALAIREAFIASPLIE